MFHSFGPLEIGLILVIVLIIFGVGKLPQVGGAIGKGLREFRKASHDVDTTEEVETKPKVTASKKALKS